MSYHAFNKNPDTRRCNRCGKVGHIARACTEQPVASTTAPTGPQPANVGTDATPASPIPQPLPSGRTWVDVVSASPSAPPPVQPTQAPRTQRAPTQTVPTQAPPTQATIPKTPSIRAPWNDPRVAIPFKLMPPDLRPAAASSRPSTARPSSAAVLSVPSTTVPLSTTAPGPSSAIALDPIKQAHERGHRIGYGTRRDPFPDETQGKMRTVITNYVRITKRPDFVYVYKLKIVRETGAEGEEFLIKDRTEKKAIFEQLKLQANFSGLADGEGYATDHDLIWATKPLFPVVGGEHFTPQPVQGFSASHPHTQLPIAFQSVSVCYVKHINASQSPSDLLKSSNASAEGADDAAILVRGFNAFMTQHARDKMATQRYASTAANRFFLTQGTHEEHLEKQRFNHRVLRAFRGFSVSTRPGAHEMLLNIHVGASPFLENVSIHQLLRKFRDMRVPPRQAFNILRGKEAVITTNNPPINVIVTKVGNTILDDHLQNWKSLEDALGRTYRRRDLSDLPLTVTPQQTTNSVRAADVKLHGFYAFRGAMTDEQTSTMLTFACKLPIYNKKHLENSGFEMLGINTAAGQHKASGFGMSVETSLLKVPARYLKPPALRYNRDSAPKNFKEASWNLNTLRFFRPSTAFEKVLILDLHGDDPDLSALDSKLQTELRNLGMSNVRVTDISIEDQPVDDDDDSGSMTEAWLLQHLSGQDKTVSAPVFIVLPYKSYDSYSRVKRVADLQLGRHAVCAVGSKFVDRDQKISTQCLANIGMKFNLKGAGTNHAVEESHLASILRSATQPTARNCQTIIIGADVAHPTGSARPGCPSIAAVVGSTDDHYLHYPGSMRLQISRQEFIADLADMVKERLIDWAEKHGGRLPANMLFYRDGVSESQYKAVREHEITQLETAYQKAHEYLKTAGPTPSFKLTFIVVGKRHNTRFFTDESCEENTFHSDLVSREVDNRFTLERQEDQKFKPKVHEHTKRPLPNKYTRVNHNVRPGFVIDEVITHPISNDFFLQSHKPLQGTGRSAHYFVLTNQMCLNSDDLQRVTHALCYIYARATKGVSYCAPAYYADRLCDRGRAWLREHLMGRMWVEKGKDEKFDEFRQRARDTVDQDAYWRPPRSDNPRGAQKYGQPRKNPWHPNLDDIMFYL